MSLDLSTKENKEKKTSTVTETRRYALGTQAAMNMSHCQVIENFFLYVEEAAKTSYEIHTMHSCLPLIKAKNGMKVCLI